MSLIVQNRKSLKDINKFRMQNEKQVQREMQSEKQIETEKQVQEKIQIQSDGYIATEKQGENQREKIKTWGIQMKRKLLVMSLMLIMMIMTSTSVFAAYTVGSTSYSTLADAFTNAASGSTITVTSNMTDASSPSLASGKTLTLNTNGYTITMTSNTITTQGTLTITGNGTISGDGHLYAVYVTAGTLNLNSGTLKAKNARYFGYRKWKCKCIRRNSNKGNCF